ncbi:hypothetical protein [Streptomyces sp. WAC06614]|uniref:hypothetical protein n=1 Tax=Streptomyces sp. WAC06614 TaxID=2487416 RepID=UPI000F782E6E|nr:hypothetical protein [Streptomyces sp. WAC06614]RSS83588.1 hypothetical protein EF918_03155 [Streptomyces sp. WAC06614]
MIDTDPYEPGPEPPQDDSGTVARKGIGDPAAALGRIIQRREQLLRQESAVLESLRVYSDLLRRGPRPVPSRPPAPPQIETLVSTEDVAARVDRMLGAAEKEVLVLDRLPHGRGREGAGEVAAAGCRHVRGLLARGVTVRTVTDRTGTDFPDKAKVLTVLTELGLQVRTGPRLPTSLLLVDRRTCLLPVSGSTDVTGPALVFGERLLRRTVLPLFESLWGRATPVGDAGSPLTPGQRELLGLLAAGLKDESIARRLGVHVHTARRRINQLLGELDADTRFQAGIQAATRGWLHPIPEG